MCFKLQDKANLLRIFVLIILNYVTKGSLFNHSLFPGKENTQNCHNLCCWNYWYSS